MPPASSGVAGPTCSCDPGGAGRRYTIKQQRQMPSATSGNVSATTVAIPNRPHVTIARTRIRLRTRGDTSCPFISTDIKPMYVALTRKKTMA